MMTHATLPKDDPVSKPSASGAFWRDMVVDESRAAEIARIHALPDAVARLLALRGLAPDQIAGFLDPKLRTSLPDPMQFQDMRKGAERLVAAIQAGETVAVFGDYDVDGATSSALLLRYFRSLGLAPLVHIPDRMKEGYGPNAAAFDALQAQGATLVMTVDCGTLAFEPLAHARAAGLDVMVVDHHQAAPNLPDAVAVINPNRLDECGACRQLAAVGVCFLLLIAVQRLLEEAGYFVDRPKPDLLALLDIVAVGTVCDVVPLTELNRSFVHQGLKILSRTSNPGLQALRQVAGVADKPLQASHLGFALGPRINAGGRVGRASAGVELLMADDPLRATELAKELDGYNAERRAIEAGMVEQALAQAEAELAAGEEGAMMIVASNGWHEGIIGIVASRLKEKYHRPAMVISLAQGGMGKGSGRSVPGFDMGAAVISAVSEGLLMKGGGHHMAAGFSVDPNQLAAFRDFMNRRYQQADCHSNTQEYQVDTRLRASGMTLEFLHQLSKLAPFGTANSQPLIMLPGVRLLKSSIVGNGHVKTLWVDASISHAALPGITFGAADSQLGQKLLAHPKRIWDILVTAEIDHWQGQERVNMMLKDARIVPS